MESNYVTKACPGCGREFRARVRQGREQNFCSRACQKAHRPMVEITCEWCERTFLYDKVAAHISRGAKGRRFCSHECKLAHWRAKGKPAGRERLDRRVTSYGYIDVYAPDHPSVQERAYKRVYEHRLVMERVLGRVLHPWETVHHIDGDKTNNAPENLELWVKTQPTGIRLQDVAGVYGGELLAARKRILELECRVRALEAQLKTSPS